MSKTDQHLPYAVRMLDPKRRIEIHNHTLGPCDLPDLEEVLKHGEPWGTRCRWDLKLSDLYENHTCGCWMCRGYSRKETHRRERNKGKKQVREQYTEYLEEINGTSEYNEPHD